MKSTSVDRLIDGASFRPATVKAMGEAFDQAWAEIAGDFGTNVAALKAGALHAIAMDYG
jgi:hypothetical protein